MEQRRIRVLIVDDSALMRGLLSKSLDDKFIEVIGVARDPFEARDMILEHHPDVMTLDVQMPKMNGVDFLKRLMPQYPLATIMVSAHTDKGAQTTLDALHAGAIDYVLKPSSASDSCLNEFIADLKNEIRIAATVNIKDQLKKILSGPPKIQTTVNIKGANSVVVMGASTGGTDALSFVLSRLPKDFPGVVVVQHMPSGFTKAFADRLNRSSEIEVVEGTDGEEVTRGKVIIAPGGVQCALYKEGGTVRVACRKTDKIDGHCPSVTNLFNSAASVYGKDCVAVIMTGMGKDGCSGMKVLKDKGAYNIAQNEETCVVYGMPRVAVEKQFVHSVVPLDQIASKLIDYFRG